MEFDKNKIKLKIAISKIKEENDIVMENKTKNIFKTVATAIIGILLSTGVAFAGSKVVEKVWKTPEKIQLSSGDNEELTKITEESKKENITEEDAKKLVEHLRKNNLGRASFLPIASVKGKKLEKLKGNESGVIGIASDLVKFNKKYEQIILNLLGRTVIVDNMDTAIRVAKENGQNFKIVTQEGDIINTSGAITGGAVMKKTVNILGRENEIKKLGQEIKKLQENIEKIH